MKTDESVGIVRFPTIVQQFVAQIPSISSHKHTELDNGNKRFLNSIAQPFSSIDWLFSSMDQLFASIAQPFSSIDWLVSSMDQLFASIAQPFSSIDWLVSSMNQLFASIAQPFSSIDWLVSSMDQLFASLAQPFTAGTEIIDNHKSDGVYAIQNGESIYVAHLF